MSKTLALIISHFILLSLIGCSGGGSDSTVDLSGDAATADAAEPDLIVDENALVTLNAPGAASDAVSYAWTQVDGPSVSLEDTDQASLMFTAPTATTQQVLTFQVVVTHSDGATTTDLVEVAVRPVNALPTAHDDSASTQLDTPVTIDLVANDTDADGSLDPGSVEIVTPPSHGTPRVDGDGTIEYTPASGFIGTDQLHYTVQDTEGGRSETALVTITVAPPGPPPNQAPTANAGPDQTANEETLVMLTGTASDPDGSIAAYAWTQISGTKAESIQNAENAAATFTAPTITVPETLTFRLAVSDDEGATAMDTVGITVNPVNEPPTVDAGPDQTVRGEMVVHLRGRAHDLDGSIALYEWTLVDGTAVTLQRADKAGATFTAPTLPAPETLNLRLTVTDNEGAVAKDTVRITVNAPNSPPVAANECHDTPLGTVLTGNLSDQVQDADDTSFDFDIPESDGEFGKGRVTINAQTGKFTYTPSPGKRGTDRFTYTVDDLHGGTDTAEVTVIIDDTPIMPLGDSITAGVASPSHDKSNRDELVGYRGPLFDALKTEEFAVDFVGSRSNGLIRDPDNEGHGGISDEQVAEAVYGWLSANPADIVLLHIGTNGLNETNATASSDVERILDEIDRWEFDNGQPVAVFLARIIDWMPNNPNVQTFNDNLQALAEGRISMNDDKIVIVNQQAALVYTPEDMSSRLHPNTAGYIKMADTWSTAIKDSGLICKPPVAL